MSIHATNWAWSVMSTYSVTQSSRLVLLRLADRANSENICWPGVNSIAADCGLTEVTVRKALRELANKKLIRIERRKDRQSRDITSLYTLLIDGGKEFISGRKGSDRNRGNKMTPNHNINHHLINETVVAIDKADALNKIKLLKQGLFKF